MRRWPWVLCLAAGLAAASPAVAGDPDAARSAYDKASAAFARKSYAEAAAGFAVADGLEPNPVALESALKAALLADDPVLGMELVERSEARPKDPRVEVAAAKAREKFAARAGRLSVSCPDERGCSATLSGTKLQLGKRVWVRPGAQQVTVDVDGHVTAHAVEVPGGAAVDFVPVAPPRLAPPAPTIQTPPAPPSPAPPQSPPRPAPEAEASTGIHPAWLAVGAVATAALAGVTIWSGVDTLDKHDAFEAGDDGARGPGEDAQLRTNILLGATLVSAAGTAVTAIFVDWGGPSSAGSLPAPRGVAVRLRY